MSLFCLPSGNLFSRVVVPCSLFKKVLLLVDLLFKQLPRNNYPGQIVCRWRGSWHELRRARGTGLGTSPEEQGELARHGPCERGDEEPGSAGERTGTPSSRDKMLFPVLSRDGFGGSLSKEGPEVGGPTGEEESGFLTGRVFGVLVQRSPFNTEHRGGDSGHHAQNPINYNRF